LIEYDRITLSAVIAHEKREIQYSRDAGDEIEKPRRTGYPALRADDDRAKRSVPTIRLFEN